jgi:flagellar biosynthesis protein FlhF
MTPRKYLAASARDALRRIKEELGPDAIVLSNRPVEGGVEILALPANALDSMTAPARKPAAQPVAKTGRQGCGTRRAGGCCGRR